MLDARELARIALRYDTAMSRAMLRALGVAMRPRPAPREAWRRPDPLEGIGWCFRNYGSPMDWH